MTLCIPRSWNSKKTVWNWLLILKAHFPSLVWWTLTANLDGQILTLSVTDRKTGLFFSLLFIDNGCAEYDPLFSLLILSLMLMQETTGILCVQTLLYKCKRVSPLTMQVFSLYEISCISSMNFWFLSKALLLVNPHPVLRKKVTSKWKTSDTVSLFACFDLIFHFYCYSIKMYHYVPIS